MHRTALFLSAALWIALGPVGPVQGQEPFRRGDANVDGEVNISDGITVLGFLFVGNATLGCLDAGDSDDSGKLQITDGIIIFQFLFLGGEAPPHPGPHDCGLDPPGDPLSCQSYGVSCGPTGGRPLLAVSPATLEFTGGATIELTLRNAGGGTLEWTAASAARWLKSAGRSVVEAPLSSSARGTGLGAGESVKIPLSAVPAGLKAGATEGELTVTTNGGAVVLPARVTVTAPDLNGIWVGAYRRGQASLLPAPGIALRLDQVGDALKGSIDGRLAPAFATSIRRQAHDVSFEPAEGSVASGVLEVTAVPADAPAEAWTAVASGAGAFAVAGSLSGAQGTAQVGEAFSTAGGMTLLISPPRNDRSYRTGDTFRFRVGSYGFVAGELTGSLSGSLSGAFALDPELSGLRPGVTRTLTMSAFEIVETNVLDADLEVRHRGLLSGRDVVTSGRVRLVKRQ